MDTERVVAAIVGRGGVDPDEVREVVELAAEVGLSVTRHTGVRTVGVPEFSVGDPSVPFGDVLVRASLREVRAALVGVRWARAAC